MHIGQTVTIKKNIAEFNNNVHYRAISGQDVVIERMYPADGVIYVRHNGTIYSVIASHVMEKDKKVRKSSKIVPNLAELNDAEKIARITAGELRFYLVVNSKGQFFRAKGYSGGGECWVTDVKKARVYGRIGPARACITFYRKNTKMGHAVPKIIEIGPEGRRYVE